MSTVLEMLKKELDTITDPVERKMFEKMVARMEEQDRRANEPRKHHKETMPAGTYFIGDPCYVIPDDEWSDFVGPYCVDYRDGDGLQIYKGMKVFAASTSCGDGCYRDNRGNSYGVDSGMLGIVPVELCDPNELDKVMSRKDLGAIMKYDRDFEVSCSPDAVFTFGHIVIET